MSDIDTVVVDSLKALDPNRPIREADVDGCVPDWFERRGPGKQALLPALPRMAHRPGAGKLTVELADERDAVGEAKLSAGGGDPEFFAGVAPSTTKLAPGSIWNTAASARSLTQSCAQESRARSEQALL